MGSRQERGANRKARLSIFGRHHLNPPSPSPPIASSLPQHPNVIRFHDVLEDERHYYLVTEYMVGREGGRGGKERGGIQGPMEMRGS